MANMNSVILTGNLTKDMEVRTTQSGASVGSFGIAVNEKVKNSQTGEWENYANFFNCTVFGKRADALVPYLKKGKKIGLRGHLHYSAWEENGSKRSAVQVNVDEIELLGSKADDAQAEKVKEVVPVQSLGVENAEQGRKQTVEVLPPNESIAQASARADAYNASLNQGSQQQNILNNSSMDLAEEDFQF